MFALHYFTFYYQPRRAHNYFTTQLGTSCSFDSPGLARNEPTPGKHSQGDSTPSVLSFFRENMVSMRGLIGCYVNIPMNTSPILNVITTQYHRCYINVPMNVFATMNTLTTQLGTSCSFDSPGLARNEPTPGKHSQGDSTPSVLSFFCEGMLTMNPFMAD